MILILRHNRLKNVISKLYTNITFKKYLNMYNIIDYFRYCLLFNIMNMFINIYSKNIFFIGMESVPGNSFHACC